MPRCEISLDEGEGWTLNEVDFKKTKKILEKFGMLVLQDRKRQELIAMPRDRIVKITIEP